MPPPDRARPVVYLDLTHVGRHVTGLERIAIELFEKAHFANADIRPIRAANLVMLILKQQLLFPLLALINPRAHFIFPGFPPSPLMIAFRDRVVLYVHDLFLVTRPQDLGLKAKLYMARPFRLAVSRLRHFLTNSAKTRAELEPFVASDARIELYRPTVANVFGVGACDRSGRTDAPSPLKIVAIGTVEPRKNYRAAAAIRHALARAGFDGCELHIIGRRGWGPDADALGDEPGIVMHGYLSLDEARAIIETADIYISTAHDEGLGLPLLEVQFAGLPVVAADIPVFREVLGTSGTYIPTDDAETAARLIRTLVETPGWRRERADAARENLDRWNTAAMADAARVRVMFRSVEPTAQPTAAEAAPRG
ncbi:MAG: glycosyltransferase [Hyphomicrobiaceae bacterium]|nr:glycosyltransferase [Hyphomicrobiaceae bacterium]